MGPYHTPTFKRFACRQVAEGLELIRCNRIALSVHELDVHVAMQLVQQRLEVSLRGGIHESSAITSPIDAVCPHLANTTPVEQSQIARA